MKIKDVKVPWVLSPELVESMKRFEEQSDKAFAQLVKYKHFLSDAAKHATNGQDWRPDETIPEDYYGY